MLDFCEDGCLNFAKHSCSHFYDAMKYSVELEIGEMCLQTVLLEVNMEYLFLSLRAFLVCYFQVTVF